MAMFQCEKCLKKIAYCPGDKTPVCHCNVPFYRRNDFDHKNEVKKCHDYLTKKQV